MANKKSHTNVLYWNANGIQHKIQELYNHMSTNHIHIACLNESHLKPHIKIQSHPNFIIYRKDNTTKKGGGVAIIVHKRIKHKLLPHINTTTIENISVEIISTNNEKITITSIYIPPKPKNSKLHLKRDLDKLTSNNTSFFICGDFNARHKSWNNYSNNTYGLILSEFVSNNKFLLMFPHQFSRFPNDKRSKPSTIDLVLTSGLHETTEFSCTTMSSDHVAISFKVSTRSDFENPLISKLSYNFQLADWELYKHVIQFHTKTSKKIDDLKNPSEVDTLIENITKVMEHAKNRAIPKTTITRHNLILTDEIKSLITHKNSLRRRWQVTRNREVKGLLNYAEKEIKQKITQLRNDNWQYKLENIAADNKAVWATYQLIKKRNNSLPPLKDGDNIILPPADKAELFAKTFANNHVNPLNNTHEDFTQHVHESSLLPLNISHQDIDYCDEEELLAIIKRLKNKKAPGIDGINNRLIKNLPPNAIKYLCLIVNGCLKFQHFPAKWKKAKVIPILKSGKPLDSTESYRPISLLSAMSKLLERVILNRLNRHITERHILPDEQHGFRAGHSTTSQLHTLINNAKEELTEGKSTGLICMDVSKAFDLVWHDGLIYKMRELDFPSYLTAIIRNFLTDRSFSVSIGNYDSSTYSIPAGVPQGSVISPILYNLYTHDMPSHDDTSLTLFADDTAFRASHTHVCNILTALREHSTQISEYMELWKININREKTQAIFITRRRTREVPKRTFKIFNKSIKWATEAKYLGVILDKRLTMKDHVSFVLRKVNTAISTLYPLLCRKSKLNLQNKLLIYKMAIRPIMTYATPAYYHLLAPTNSKKLQIAQNGCLKLCLDLPRRTRTIQVHQMAQVPTLNEFIDKLTEKFRQNPNI